MRRTIRKLFWVWDFDKEERWLNQMASKGLALVAVSNGKYTFEEGTPGAYHIRLELLENLPTHGESQQYIRFIEETGGEYLGSVIRWVYFRRKREAGAFDLYSDNPSRIRHLNRMLLLMGVVAAANIAVGLVTLLLLLPLGEAVPIAYSILLLGIGLFLACGFFSIARKRRKLKREQALFE